MQTNPTPEAGSVPPIGPDEISCAPGVTYLNHAAAGVLPHRTAAALMGLIAGHEKAGILGFLHVESNLPSYRASVGAFIGADANEIAFLRNTSDGANTIARGLAWRSGDDIVLCDNEFPSNVLPYCALREHGVSVTFVRTAWERMTPEVLARTMTAKTKLVAVSWVGFGDGYRHDLAALAAVAHERGALFCVDAIQGLGAFALDVRACGIDALYAGGAKWLMALPGMSFLYVSTALQERLTVRWRGWRDVVDIGNYFDYEQPHPRSAARFEGGTQNFLGIAALEASLGVLEAAGTDRIGTHVLALTDRLYAGLESRGAKLNTFRGPGISSGIVSFSFEGTDPVELGRALGVRRFVTTFRASGVRVSPHGYNTFDEIDAFLGELDALT